LFEATATAEHVTVKVTANKMTLFMDYSLSFDPVSLASMSPTRENFEYQRLSLGFIGHDRRNVCE